MLHTYFLRLGSINIVVLIFILSEIVQWMAVKLGKVRSLELFRKHAGLTILGEVAQRLGAMLLLYIFIMALLVVKFLRAPIRQGFGLLAKVLILVNNHSDVNAR